MQEADKMIEKGFKLQFSYQDEIHKRVTPKNPPLYGVVYIKGELNVWTISGGRYQTAYLRNGMYVEHKPFKTLEEVFKNYNLF